MGDIEYGKDSTWERMKSDPIVKLRFWKNVELFEGDQKVMEDWAKLGFTSGYQVDRPSPFDGLFDIPPEISEEDLDFEGEV